MTDNPNKFVSINPDTKVTSYQPDNFKMEYPSVADG